MMVMIMSMVLWLVAWCGEGSMTVRSEGQRLSSKAKRTLLGRQATVVIFVATDSEEALRRVTYALGLYVSYEDIVRNVVVHWPTEVIPAELEDVVTSTKKDDGNARASVIASAAKNTLLGRWILTAPYLKADLVLTLDDDLLLLENGLRCLLLSQKDSTQDPAGRSISGPYVKNVEREPLTYLPDDDGGQEFALVLPRLMLVRKSLVLRTVRDARNKDLLRYIRGLPKPNLADDVLLSYAAGPFKQRVILPPATVFDYSKECALQRHTTDNTFWKTSMLRLIAKEQTFLGENIHASNASTCDIQTISHNETAIILKPLLHKEHVTQRFNDMHTQENKNQLCLLGQQNNNTSEPSVVVVLNDTETPPMLMRKHSFTEQGRPNRRLHHHYHPMQHHQLSSLD